MKLAGSTVAIITAYVGEQVLNIGHKTNQRRISDRSQFHQDQLFCCALLVNFSIPVMCISFCHNVGNKKNIPNTIRIYAEILVRSSGKIPKRSTKNLIRSVKRITERAKDEIITRGRDFFHSITDHQTITGSNGSTHGAKTVNTHAKNDSQSNHMIFLIMNIKWV